MPSFKIGTLKDDNKGVWYKGFIFPLIKIKFNDRGGGNYIIDRPAFNKPNFETYFLPFINSLKKDRVFKDENEAQVTYIKWIGNRLPSGRIPEDDDGLTIGQISKKHNSAQAFNLIYKEEQRRVKNMYPKTASKQTLNMSQFTSFKQYQTSLTSALATTGVIAEEGKAVAEKEGLAQAKAGAGIALVAKKMIRQTSVEVKKKGEELENIKLELKEAKAKEGKGLTMVDIQKIIDDTFVNGDPTADEEDILGEDADDTFGDDGEPYIHNVLKFVRVGEDGQPIVIRRPTDEEVNTLVKYHNEHAQHQQSMTGSFYYKFTEDDPEVKALRDASLRQRQQLDQQRVMFQNQMEQHETTKEELKQMEAEYKTMKLKLKQYEAEELGKMGLLPLEQDDDENVAVESKDATNEVIDPTKSAGMSVQQRKANLASLRGARKPTNPALASVGQPSMSAQRASEIMRRFTLRQEARIRMGKLRRERLNVIATANAMRQQQIDEELQREQDFLNNVGIGSATVPVVDNTPMAETIASTEVADKERADASTEADDAQKEDADYADTEDNEPDVSKFGYGKQVAKFAKEQGRDFTYTMSLIAKSKNAPSQNEAQRKKQKERLLAEWGETIGIKKAKGNTFEECLEIYTIVFLAKDMYRIERNWKKMTIKYLPLLENLSHQSTQQTATQTQLGMITMGQNPMTMTQADELIRQTQSQGSKTRGVLRSIRKQGEGKDAEGEETKADVGVSPNLRGQSSYASTMSNMSMGDFTDAEEGDARRRLGGFNTNVTYSRQQTSAERNPNMSAGVQSVRQIKAQRARPPPRASKRNSRPKMNVAEAQFKMRKSRINPNLLFVNLDKQNPRPSVDPPTFRTRTNDKKFRRIKF